MRNQQRTLGIRRIPEEGLPDINAHIVVVMDQIDAEGRGRNHVDETQLPDLKLQETQEDEDRRQEDRQHLHVVEIVPEEVLRQAQRVQ